MSLLRVIRKSAATRAIPWRWLGALAAIAVAFLAVPPLAQAPARLVSACGEWITVAAGLELLSILGFVLVFSLVFGARSSVRQTLGAGLRALGAITVLPAGGVVGPAVAAKASADEPPPLSVLTRSTIALTILTTAPSLLVLGGLGLMLYLGWPPGPHDALRTLPEAGLAVAAVAGMFLLARSSEPRHASRVIRPRFNRRRHLIAAARCCRDGGAEARRLVADGNWKLAGAIGYYAFDNAVLWAAFHAYGRTPAVAVIMMGYLVGSLGAALPLPAGIGAVEGGLIGALVLYGAPAAPAAGAVLLYRGISLSLPVVLGALAWGLVPARRLRSARRRGPRRRQPIRAHSIIPHSNARP
jgi:uncharacterized membrane protein YbhN (UPF0104 family)